MIYQASSRLKRMTQHLMWSLKFHGLRGTIVGGLAAAVKGTGRGQRLRKWCRRYKDERFDQRFQVETAKCVSTEDLNIAPDRRDLAVEYAATSPISFCHIISGLAIDFRHFVFVDVGSGKGRVLLLASEFPFKQVFGVELSEGLHQIAGRNIATYSSRSRRCFEVYSVLSDATSYSSPIEPTVFYLYNPFHTEILELVLSQMRRSFEQSPRQMLILYHNPVHRNLMDSAPYLRQRNTDDEAWAIYEFVSVP